VMTYKRKRNPHAYGVRVLLRKRPQNSLEKRFEKILIELGVDYKKQAVVWVSLIRGHKKYKVYDFQIPSKKILIEIDGDYWHCNPKKYPNGPINRVQKRNILNDSIKDRVAIAYGYQLIRIWEDDINNNTKNVTKSLKKVIGKINLPT